MYINRKAIALLLIWFSIIAVYYAMPSLSYVFTPEYPIEPKLVQGGIVVTVVLAVTWLNWRVLTWVERSAVQPDRHQRVEKLLRQLEDEDLDLLRDRLNDSDHDGLRVVGSVTQ